MMIAVSIYDYAWKPFFFARPTPTRKTIFPRDDLPGADPDVLFMAFTFCARHRAHRCRGRFIHPRYWAVARPGDHAGIPVRGVSPISPPASTSKEDEIPSAGHDGRSGLNIALNYLRYPGSGSRGGLVHVPGLRDHGWNSVSRHAACVSDRIRMEPPLENIGGIGNTAPHLALSPVGHLLSHGRVEVPPPVGLSRDTPSAGHLPRRGNIRGETGSRHPTRSARFALLTGVIHPLDYLPEYS